MKNKIVTTLFSFLLTGFSIFSQSVNVTVDYNGFQSCGGCTVCGADYWCINSIPSYCGNTPACRTQTFWDPIPAGNVVTGVTIVCYAGPGWPGSVSSVTSQINTSTIGSTAVSGSGYCGECYSFTMSNTYSCPNGLPGYTYGGNNSFTLCPNGSFCVERAVITFTYTVCCVLSTAPSFATASPSSFCSGGSTTLSVGGGSLGTGASWNWYSGWCGGTFVGSGSSIFVSPTTTTTYFVRAQGNCNTTGCASVTVTVNTPSTAPSWVSASPNPTCGGATTLTEMGGTLGTGANYNWYSGGCGGSFIGSGTSINVAPSSTTTYYVLATGTCNTTACASVTVTVSSLSIAPSSASVSPNPVCAGVSTTLTENGGTLGAGAVYNWYSGSCGGTFVGSGSSISVTPSSTTTYFVLAQGTCNTTGCASVTVTVNPVPFATASPSSQSICSGNTTSIALSSFTPGTSFSWTVAQSGVSGAFGGSGTSIAQTLNTSGTSPGTATYTITPVANGCIGSPITVVVTVNPIPFATATPNSQTICSGNSTLISLGSNVSGTSFNWTVAQTGVSGATNSSGSSITQTITTTGGVSGTAIYTITPVANGCSGTPIIVSITVDPSPMVIATPLTQTICSGSATSIALTSNVVGTTFAWTVAQTGGVTGGTSGTGISITDVLTTTTTGTAVYTILPTANSCIGNPTTVTITVNPMDDASFIYSSATYCQTGNDTSAMISGLPGGVFSSTAGLVFLNTSTGLIDFSASTLGTYVITYTTNGICQNTSTVNLTITGAPATGFSYTGSPFCQFGSNPSPTFVPGAFAGTFSSTPAGLSFVNVNTGVIDLATSAPGTYTIKNIIAASGGCGADSATTTVTINSTPIVTATPMPETICSLTATSITLTSTLPGTTFAWTVASTNVTGDSPGIGSSIVQTLTATGTVPGIAIYTITPTVGSCAGAPINDTVTVNLITVATATPTSQTFCSGGTTSIVLSGSVAGTTFSWTASQAGVTGALFGSGSTISQTLTTTGTSVGTVVYTITPSANGCLGSAINITVTVNPMDDASFVYPSATYCTSGTPQTPSITGLPGGTFSATPAGLSINPTTGTIDLGASSLGVYILSYTTNGICPNTSSITMTITNTTPSAIFSYPSASYCQNGPNPFPVYVSGASAGIYTATPVGLVFIQVNTGQINLAASSPGTYLVTNTIPISGTCLGVSDTTTVTITASDDATFIYSSGTYCISGPNQTPTITGLPGGVFSSSPVGLSIDALTGMITLSTSQLGIYTISYATNGPCPDTSSITMTIDSITPTAVFTYSGASFCQSASNPSPIFGSGSSAGTFTSSPFGLVFVNSITGQIDLAASTPGTYTVTNTIPASGSCNVATATTTITITNLDDASFVYSSASYCLTGSNPTPAITGLPGGIFTSTPFGLTINPSTGTVDLASSTLGSYTITYTTASACQNSSSITLTITTNNLFADFSYSGSPFCQNGINPLPVFASGASAGVFSTNPIGLAFVNLNTGEIDLLNSAPGTYTVTNTIPAGGGCASVVATTTVTITSTDDASFVYTSATYCTTGTPQTPVVTGLSGGTFSATPAGLSINPTTGTITLSACSAGAYLLTYTTNGACPNSSSIIMTIDTITPSATFSYAGSPFCQNANNPFPTFGPNASAGIYTATPSGLVFVSVNTGEIDLSACTPGTYIVTNTIPASGICLPISDTYTITIGASDDASFTYPSATYCVTGPNQTPAITGLTGGIFSSIPPGLTLDPTTGTITLSTSAIGSYTLTYSTNGSCPNSSSIIMTIADSTPFANFNYSASTFCQNASNQYPIFGSGASAGIFSSSPAGLVIVHVNTGEIDIVNSVPGTYTVTNDIPASGICNAISATTTVIIAPSDDASFSYPSATYCTTGAPQSPTITGFPGGTFSSIPAGLTLNPATGTITLSSSLVGSYLLTYTTFGACPNTSSITMTINDIVSSASFSYVGSPFCQSGGNNPFPTFGLDASAGIFSATPAGLVFAQVNTGEIDLAASTPGTYTVTNTIPASGVCVFVSAVSTVTINAAPVATVTPSSSAFCASGTAPVSIVLTSDIPGSTFTWTVSQSGLTGGLPGSGSTISQTLNSGTNCGTATYTIIADANGCSGASITVPIDVCPSIVDTASMIITQANCGSTTGSITGITMASGQSPFTYQWYDSQNNPVGNGSADLTNVGAGLYTVTITNGNNCSIIVGGPFVITATPPVVAAFTLSPMTGETPLTVNFTNNSSIEAVNYLWEFGTGDTSIEANPTYTYIPLGSFMVCLTADNGFGCSDSACSTVEVYINSVFIIPNIFTPNGDGINDVFTVQGIGLKSMDAEIFNRWGEKEYEWHTTNGGWDGRTTSGVEAPNGTYYFIINAVGIDGKKYLEKGSFTLIRNN